MGTGSQSAPAEWKISLNQDPRASEAVDPQLLLKLESRGYVIDQSDEVQWYLDYRKANAATFLQKDLLLRHDPRLIEVLEEYLHNVQRKIGLTDVSTPWELEIHVKEFMLRHQTLLGISQADAEWIADWLDDAQQR